MGDGDDRLSDTEEPGEAQSPEDAEEAFRERQLDAVFTVTGPAPEWALKWPGDRKDAP